MTGQTEGRSAGADTEELRLPRLVRSQLRRRREAPRGEGLRPAGDIEEQVREALYGRSYYRGTNRRVHTELEGKHAA